MKYNIDNLVILSERPFQIVAALCLLVAALFCARTALAFFVPVHLLDFVSNGLLLNAQVISLLIILAVLCMVGEFGIRSFLLGRNLPLYIIRTIRRRHAMS